MNKPSSKRQRLMALLKEKKTVTVDEAREMFFPKESPKTGKAKVYSLITGIRRHIRVLTQDGTFTYEEGEPDTRPRVVKGSNVHPLIQQRLAALERAIRIGDGLPETIAQIDNLIIKLLTK